VQATEIQEPIYTVHTGDNSGLIKKVSELYFKDGDKIADVTYGRGVFWRQVDTSKYEIIGTDLKTGTDFRNLPYDDDAFNHTVIDPPYARITNLQGMVDCYNTTRYTTHDEILELYRAGLKELKRITKPGGYIFVKCQDEIYGGKQKWTHIEIHEMAVEEFGFYTKDLFVLVNTRKPKPLYKQQHVRKNHSYLWVFQVKAN